MGSGYRHYRHTEERRVSFLNYRVCGGNFPELVTLAQYASGIKDTLTALLRRLRRLRDMLATSTLC